MMGRILACPATYAEPDDPFYELDWEFLHEHPHILERHWERAWREGRV